MLLSQKQLWDIERKFQKRIQERVNETQELKEAVKSHKVSFKGIKNCLGSFRTLFRFVFLS